MSCRSKEDFGHKVALSGDDYQESKEVFHIWGSSEVLIILIYGKIKGKVFNLIWRL